MPSYLNVREAAEYLGLSPSTIYKLAERGAVPSGKVGGSWRFSREALDQFIGARPLSAEPVVFVVDPDPLARLRLAHVAQRRTSRLQALPDGESALTAAALMQPDVIFFSPREGAGEEAVEFMRALRDSGIQTRVVLVIGLAEFAHVAAVPGPGPLWILRKPVEPQDVVLMLNTVTR